MAVFSVVSNNSMCPGLHQPLKRWGVRKADNLPPSSADVMESGNINLPEPSGPHRPVMGFKKTIISICVTYSAGLPSISFILRL
jgi:hypothetical protein